MMHTELVEKKRWIDNARFLHALNFCMLLPGPEAHQLAIYIGWLWHKTRGGIVAGALFVIPSIFILWALSYVYVVYGGVPWIAAIFYGLKPAVLAIVAAAVIRIGSKALKNAVMWTIAAAAFVAIYFFHVPFPVIVVTAAVIGLLGAKILPDYFRGRETLIRQMSILRAEAADSAKPSLLRASENFGNLDLDLGVALALAGVFLGTQHTIFREGIFFSKAAVVTFGGAYAVLPYVSQQAVEHYHWLAAPQMLDGLGLAETTPGPLIMVLQFVGFLGAWNHPGNLPPLMSATLGALITTWTTFVPCFLWVFLGAPYIEKLRGQKSTHGRAFHRHRRGRRRDSKPRRLVWIARYFPANGNIDWFASWFMRGRICRNASLEMEYCPRRARQRTAWPDLHAGWLPLRDWDAPYFQRRLG